MSAESRWIRLNTDWHLSSWLITLSAESRLAWVQLLCHVKVHGFGGAVKAVSPAAAERLWFVNEPSIRQMLIAAENAGALVVTDELWTVVKWAKYQGDSTAKERQRRFKERQKVTDNNALVTEVTPTETETETIKKNTKKKFTAPTLEEVQDYARGRGESLSECPRFVDFYASKGWKVGPQSMKDWQAAWRNWASRASDRTKGNNNYDPWEGFRESA